MKTCSKFFQALFALLGLLAGLQSAGAQGRAADYVVTNFSGAFNSISGTGSLWYWYSPWTSTYGITLPFAFKFDGATIASGSTIYATTYGALALSNAIPPSWASSVQGSSSYPALLSFMQGTVSTGSNHDGDYAHYFQTTGSSPNRVLTVEFRNVHFVCAASGSGQGPANYSTHVQVKLYEGSNVIEYIYSEPGRSMGGNCFNPPSIGINGYTTPTFSSKTVATNVYSVPTQDIRFTPPPPPAQMSVQPKSIAYGSVVAGAPVTLCATVSSVGANPLTITSALLAGNADFQIVSGPSAGTILAPGASASYCIRFNPSVTGSRSSILTIRSNGADSGTQQVSLTGTGIAAGISMPVIDLFRKTKITVGDSAFMTVPVISNGTGPLTVTSVVLSGGYPDQYRIKRVPTGPIPVGQTDSITVVFKPTFMGRLDATILVNNNSLNAPVVTLKAVGIAIMPQLTITPLNVSFDSVLIGQTVCKQVILANPGTDTVNVLRMFKTFGDPDFTFTPLTGMDTMILPEQQKIFTICFTPTRNGTRVATYRFYSDIGRTIPDNRDTSQFVMSIIGTGVPFAAVSLSGTVVDSAVIGLQNCVTDNIRNTGTADFTITSASLVGLDASEYSFSGLTFPVTVRPGQSLPFSYCLTPTARGARVASISLSGSSAGQLTTMTLPLNGIGLQVCSNSDRITAFDAVMTPVGTSDSATITVTNCGDLATTYTATLGAGATNYSVVGAATSVVVAPGGTATFTVAYTPTSIGANSSSLTILGNGPGASPMIIALGGTGAGVVATATSGNAGNVIVNECTDFTVTLTNNGNIDWTPGTPSISNPEFTFVSLNPQTIAAGGTGTLTLRYCPTKIGNSTAQLIFPTSDNLTFGMNLSGAGQPGGRVGDVAMNGFVLGQNYPNPSVNAADFTVTVPAENLVRIDLFDLSGALVRNLVNGRISGEQTITVDASTLASGTYNYVLTSGDVRLVRQLTVVR